MFCFVLPIIDGLGESEALKQLQMLRRVEKCASICQTFLFYFLFLVFGMPNRSDPSVFTVTRNENAACSMHTYSCT